MYFDIANTWISDAQRHDQSIDIEGAAAIDDFTLADLDDQDLSTVAVDLDGIFDSAHSIHTLLQRLPQLEPSGDHLEDVLVELESQLGHAMSHWADLVHCLREREQWPEPEEDDLDPFRYAGSHIA